MTPSDVMALIAVWNRRNREDGYAIHAEDVSIEVSTLTGEVYGKTRASNSLRHLVDQRLLKETAWNRFAMTKAGERFCEAMRKMGLVEL